MNRETRLLLKAHKSAFRSGNTQAYSTSRADLKRGIKKAKHDHKQKVEGHFVSSHPQRMWQCIQAIADKPNKSTPTVMNVSFLNELNEFYARFDKDNKEKTVKTKPSDNHQTLTLTTTEVHNALSQINARKAAGSDGIPRHVLRASAEQLTGVFPDIFNLSLAQVAVPACFKTTSIVPVPKHSPSMPE